MYDIYSVEKTIHYSGREHVSLSLKFFGSFHFRISHFSPIHRKCAYESQRIPFLLLLTLFSYPFGSFLIPSSIYSRAFFLFFKIFHLRII